MAVSTTGTSKNFVGTGVLSVYAPEFYASNSAQVQVHVDDVLQTIGDDYVVGNVGNASGVDVSGVFASGAEVRVERVTPITQLVDTQNNETILEDVLDAGFDKLTMIAQEQDGTLARAFLVPKGESVIVLPDATSRAGKYLAFDGAGNPIIASGSGADGALRADLALTGGAALVSASDGAGGTLWTTVAGFTAKLLSSAGTSVIGFIQAGTGAVARTLQAKSRDIVNVRDYGALGDGAANDTVAIQKAIDAAPVGGTIDFGNGTFRVSGLTVSKPLHFRGGAKENATVIKGITSAASVFYCTLASGMSFEKLHFQSEVARAGGAYIEFYNANRVSVDNCRFDGAYIGVKAGLCVHISVTRCFFWQTVASTVTPFSSGIQLGALGYTGSITIDSCLMSNQQSPDVYGDSYQPSAGIDIIHADIISITNCSPQLHGAAISVRPGASQFVTYLRVSKCMLDTSRQGLVVRPTAGGFASHVAIDQTEFAVSNVVAGAVFDSALGEISDVAIVNCKILNCYAALTGIDVYGSRQVATFTGAISPTTLTASAVTGPISIGNVLTGVGVLPGTFIMKQLTGTAGGAGTYQVSQSMTATTTAMTAKALLEGLTIQGCYFGNNGNIGLHLREAFAVSLIGNLFGKLGITPAQVTSVLVDPAVEGGARYNRHYGDTFAISNTSANFVVT